MRATARLAPASLLAWAAHPSPANAFGHLCARRRPIRMAAENLGTIDDSDRFSRGIHEVPHCSPSVLPADAALPQVDDGISVLSFNVLLPNGNDGWWIYKSYQPHIPEEHRTWPFRQALVRDYLLRKDADVVCIQEASAETFEADFAFMEDAGYDAILHSKFRFRSATFFKRSRVELAFEKHKDRVLITGLRIRQRPPLSPLGQAGHDPSDPSLSAEAPGGAGVLIKVTDAVGQHSIRSSAGGTDAAHLEGDSSSRARAGPSRGDGPRAASTPQAEDGPESENSKATAERLFIVINCHLTGGPAPERRMRQVFDALETVRKENARYATAQAGAAKRTKGPRSKAGATTTGGNGKGAARPAGTGVPVVVCGDFNSDGRNAVSKLLKEGVVEAFYRELGYPDTVITSKDKRHAFGEFGDVYEEAYGSDVVGDRGVTDLRAVPPPTFLVPLLHPHFLSDDGETISPRLQEALSKIFDAFRGTVADKDQAGAKSDSARYMPREGVEAWLLRINRAVGRGSEFRAAEALMGPAPGGGLSFEEFCSIYQNELREGKFWGVAHDLDACGVELAGGIPWLGPYASRLDRIFYSKATLEPLVAMEPLSAEQGERVAGGDCLPNSWHPSDHLAVAGAFRFR